MNLWITRRALLTACGEGPPNPVTFPWNQLPSGARGALLPRLASEICPHVSPRIEQRDRACAHVLLAVHRLLDGISDLGPPERTGIILGTALGCASVNDAYHRSTLPPVSRPSPVLFGYTVPSAPVGEVAAAFGLRGHQLVIMAGACSGLAATAEACSALLLHRAAAIILLASDVLSPDRIELLHQQGSPPPVEATVALLIERPDHATSRGRAPLAELRQVTPVPASTTAIHATFTYLGATGLVELAATTSPGERLEFFAEDRGVRWRLRARFQGGGTQTLVGDPSAAKVT
ncbi:MAG: beta-ketoacyl synthase N-terminal-like domain-containing protein [Myxococcales bacterium]|nr:hypothetical protein [Polyangiaceae bacterium]MDW8250221.1 beta-ketoacyl synthase N-terminal-like domain-containing protein [Myxococcales bacterium]